MGPPIKLAVGPLLALVAWLSCWSAGMPTPAVWTASITALCAAWWVTEALPIPATSLIPFATFPLLGIMSPKELAAAYGHPLILLLLGGFMLSAAMERSGAHRRLAIALVRAVGEGSGHRIVLGFMLTSAALSMWVSNSATTLMLLPVAAAVYQEGRNRALTKPLLLGIAYAASIGGLGTPIGTPPNVVFMGVYREQVGGDLSFVDWMKIGVPAVLVMLPIAWWSVTRGMQGGEYGMKLTSEPWRARERRVLWVFAVTALLWMTRKEPFGGWSAFVPWSSADDSTVALAAVVALFVLPDGDGQRMLDWSAARSLPWGLLLLFAGGIAIAKGFDASGLSESLGAILSHLVAVPRVVMILGLCLGVTFLTEVTSNTAISTLLMPILAAAALAAGIDARALMIPAALSASCAFMLPVATVPNAVVFGTEELEIRDMMQAGLRLNLLGAVALTVVCSLLI